MTRLAKRLPSPADFEDDSSVGPITSKHTPIPTTLRAAVKVFMEKKMITEDIQDIKIAVDIEGMPQNRRPLLDTAVDVIFLIDNRFVFGLYTL